MKKALLPLTLIILLSLTGCSKTKLEQGESFVTFKKDSVSVACSLSGKDAKSEYGIRIKDNSKDIKEDLVDYFSDIFDADIKITEFKKGKDFINFTYEIEDAEDLGYYDETTLEDYADDLRYDDVEELAEEIEFITYDKEKSVDSDDIDKYEDDFVQYVTGGDKGMYYKTQNKILLVTEKLKYEKISNDTIYIKRNSSGIIVYKK
ncbi:MAG: hypothetical protein GX625_10215 [Clostridiaceae bacterium]|nr:hypothetical protein [Clostridiaceae bacterium]